jgi:hypothetical protein
MSDSVSVRALRHPHCRALWPRACCLWAPNSASQHSHQQLHPPIFTTSLATVSAGHVPRNTRRAIMNIYLTMICTILETETKILTNIRSTTMRSLTLTPMARMLLPNRLLLAERCSLHGRERCCLVRCLSQADPYPLHPKISHGRSQTIVRC